VSHPGGDIRATVIGDEVPLAFRRVPSPQGWKTNVAQGAHVEPCALTAAVRDLSLRAAEALGLGITGLDIVELGDRLLVFEANTSPGWYPLSRPEQDLLAEKCIEYMVRTALQAEGAGKRQ
jgi:glutathione synthase/RimK-type ligase-like ATP-grasp enzyme